MKDCPGTDALVTIADALDWDIEGGIRHLGSCAVCGDQMRALRAVRTAYESDEPVAAATLQRINATIGREAAAERARTRRHQNLGDGVEALLAGATALVVVITGGMNVPAALGATVFGVVATSLFAYRVWRSTHADAVRSSSPSIQ